MNIVIVIHWRSLPPRPIWSNMRGSSKICSPPMVEVMITKISVGRSIGTVTEKKVRTREAPSTTAASMMSRGMACMAASTISVL